MKKIIALSITFILMVGIFASNGATVNAKMAYIPQYMGCEKVKVKTVIKKYKNGKIKTRMDYYEDSKKCESPRTSGTTAKFYRKYNKKGQEYYGKFTTILTASKNTKYKFVDTFSNYKKNGKKLGYTKHSVAEYISTKKKGKWSQKKSRYSVELTTSKGKIKKYSTITYNKYGKIGKGAAKNVFYYYANGEIKSLTGYDYIVNKFVKTYYTYFGKDYTISTEYDKNGKNKTRTIEKNDKVYYYNWDGEKWVLDRVEEGQE